jgi:hypothetical protein
MKRHTGYLFFCLPVMALFMLSCATRSNIYKEVDLAVANNDFHAAIETIIASQESNRPMYPQRNSVMLFLDKGLLEFYAGEHANSVISLLEAERLIREAYTRSISENFLSYILNDNTKEYPGEDFEDIYLNIFNALSFNRQGNIESALVEIRKLSESSGKLNMLARRYEYKDPNSGASLEELVQQQSGVRQSNLPRGEPVEFNNSALARYLAGLFYLANRNTDSARIEFYQLQRAFLTNRNVYSHPVPSAVEEVQNVPAGKARLNIITFTGLSPVKEEETIVFPFPFFRHPMLQIATVKLPKLVERPSVIDRIRVTVDNTHTFELELLEDMSAVMKETFAVRYSNIVLKTFIRTLLKYAAADVLAMEAQRQQGNLAGIAVAAAARAGVSASENADIRMSRFLPSRAHVGGINLDPGTYNIKINFYSRGRVVSYSEHNNFVVRERGLNLIDAASLR